MGTGYRRRHLETLLAGSSSPAQRPHDRRLVNEDWGWSRPVAASCSCAATPSACRLFHLGRAGDASCAATPGLRTRRGRWTSSAIAEEVRCHYLEHRRIWPSMTSRAVSRVALLRQPRRARPALPQPDRHRLQLLPRHVGRRAVCSAGNLAELLALTKAAPRRRRTASALPAVLPLPMRARPRDAVQRRVPPAARRAGELGPARPDAAAAAHVRRACMRRNGAIPAGEALERVEETLDRRAARLRALIAPASANLLSGGVDSSYHPGHLQPA